VTQPLSLGAGGTFGFQDALAFDRCLSQFGLTVAQLLKQARVIDRDGRLRCDTEDQAF
jgi:hypothetical protein